MYKGVNVDNTNSQPTPNNLPVETPKVEVPIKEEIKYKVSKCIKCNKDGWTKSDKFEDGDKKNRLVIRMVPSHHTICMTCLDKEIR